MSDLPLFVGADIRALDGAKCFNPDADKLPPDAWFPAGKTDMEPGRIGWFAKRECRACPARLTCATQALERDEMHGIWAGFWFGDPDEKKRAANAIGVKARPKPAPCGTNAGYFQHYRANEPACDPCLKAHAGAQRRANPPAVKTPQPVAVCGTYGGAQAHKKQGEKPCDPCRIARNRYENDRRKGRVA